MTLRSLQQERKNLTEKFGRVIENDCRFEPQKRYYQKMIESLERVIEKTDGELNVSKWIGSLGQGRELGKIQPRLCVPNSHNCHSARKLVILTIFNRSLSEAK